MKSYNKQIQNIISVMFKIKDANMHEFKMHKAARHACGVFVCVMALGVPAAVVLDHGKGMRL